jgi:hypothetical protein
MEGTLMNVWKWRYVYMLQMVLKNLYTAGMMITSDRRERISTRNTVGCLAQ